LWTEQPKGTQVHFEEHKSSNEPRRPCQIATSAALRHPFSGWGKCCRGTLPNRDGLGIALADSPRVPRVAGTRSSLCGPSSVALLPPIPAAWRNRVRRMAFHPYARPSPTGSGAEDSSADGAAGRRRTWTAEEHALFLQGAARYHRSWTQVAKLVGTKTSKQVSGLVPICSDLLPQVRSHAQKFFLKHPEIAARYAHPSQHAPPLEPPPEPATHFRARGRGSGAAGPPAAELALPPGPMAAPLSDGNTPPHSLHSSPKQQPQQERAHAAMAPPYHGGRRPSESALAAAALGAPLSPPGPARQAFCQGPPPPQLLPLHAFFPLVTLPPSALPATAALALPSAPAPSPFYPAHLLPRQAVTAAAPAPVPAPAGQPPARALPASLRMLVTEAEVPPSPPASPGPASTSSSSPASHVAPAATLPAVPPSSA
jgi:hypothetical protein